MAHSDRWAENDMKLSLKVPTSASLLHIPSGGSMASKPNPVTPKECPHRLRHITCGLIGSSGFFPSPLQSPAAEFRYGDTMYGSCGSFRSCSKATRHCSS